MRTLAKKTAQLIDMLPDEELGIVNSLVTRLVKAWDPDFTKVTPEEKRQLDQADAEMANGQYYTEEEVWGK